MQKNLFLIPFISMLVLLCGSPPDPVSPLPESWPVTIHLEPEQYSETYHDLTVSGDGVFISELPFSSGKFIMVNVPSGKSRHFNCRRYDEISGDLTDTGSTIADVVVGLNSITINLSPIGPPIITSEPEDFSLIRRGYAHFLITADGFDLRYEWQKNGISFSFQSVPSVSVWNINRSDSGSSFQCIVCNSAGCDTSREAILSVIPDTTPPSIILFDSTVEVFLDSIYVDNGAFAYDSFDFVLNNAIKRTGTVNTTIAGNYTITYTVSDSAGNTATATRTVIVRPYTEKDRSRPVITLTGPDTIGFYFPSSDSTPPAPDFSAYDYEDGDITDKVVVSEWKRIYQFFMYCTYDVTDSDGNAAKTRRRFKYQLRFTQPISTP